MARKKQTVRITEKMAAMIKKLLKENELKQHEIAARFDLNQGRVSEINTGKSFAHVPPAQ